MTIIFCICVGLTILRTGSGIEFQCNKSIQASTETKNITSPAFPENYPNSYDCNVVIRAGQSDHVLHVEVVHMQLAVWNYTCEGNSNHYDFLIARDGNNTHDPVLHEWCSSDHTPVSTSGDSLFLNFFSNEDITDLGFVLRFWSQKPANTSRLNGSRQIHVGHMPVHLTLPDAMEDSCVNFVYYVTSGDNNSSITLSIISWNMSLGCQLDIYDGPTSSSLKLLSWNYDDQPFAHLTSSGGNITLVLRPMGRNCNTFTIKATRSNRLRSCGNGSKPVTEEITSLPSYIMYPVRLNSNELPCPMKLISREFSKTLRIDVIYVKGDWAFENATKYVNVTEGTMEGEAVPAIAMNGSFAYRSRGPVVYVSTTSLSVQGAGMALRVQALDSLHNGDITYKTAVNHSVSSDIGMTRLPNNAYIVYKITADHDENVVQMEMTGNLYNNKTSGNPCGDFIDFFDGNQGKLIRRWCPGSDDTVIVRSTKSCLSIVLTTDEVSSQGYYRGTYFSLRDTSMCPTGIVELKAKPNMTKVVTSPNFPGTYALKNNCTWRIAAPRFNYVVLVNVTWSDLPDDCSDLVYVIYGTYPTDKTVARICGNDTPKFRSTWPILILRFTSNSAWNRRGFQISYTTEHKSGGQRKQGGPPVGIIAGACIAIFIVGGIIYVLVHENRKRHKLRKRRREEY